MTFSLGETTAMHQWELDTLIGKNMWSCHIHVDQEEYVVLPHIDREQYVVLPHASREQASEVINSGRGTSLGGVLREVPREQKMLKGHLPRVTYHHMY